MPEQIIIQFLGLLNILGLVVFAISGTLFAAEKNMDILGVMLIGTATGIGGGTLRDLLLGISPVSWIQEPLAIYICLAACIITYFTAAGKSFDCYCYGSDECHLRRYFAGRTLRQNINSYAS